MNPQDPPYSPRRASRSRHVRLRGLQVHLHEWGTPDPARPSLVMLHGWMDVGASFQFAVDALAEIEGEARHVVAPDWRGFGRSDPGGSDAYWFPDYLGDLDALLDMLSDHAPVDLLGHSMGGNVAMVYAGVRPERVRRLVNLEGFGLPETRADQAPTRYRQWLDELKQPMALRDYDSREAVAARLRATNPLLRADRAAWLAGEWARASADGRWHILGDPAHKRANPVLYRKDEVLACWRRIEAPLLWLEGDRTDVAKWWGDRYPRSDFEARLAQVPRVERQVLAPAGHMLHHDQPEALAAHLARFLGGHPG